MKIRLTIQTMLLLALVSSAGCRTEGAYKPVNTDKYNYENEEPFVLMNRAMQHRITVAGIQETVLGDGRLEVVANIRNRRNTKRAEIQVSCVFKNENGFSTGDETPWQTMILTEAEQKSVSFTSLNALAKRYTIRVRSLR